MYAFKWAETDTSLLSLVIMSPKSGWLASSALSMDTSCTFPGTFAINVIVGDCFLNTGNHILFQGRVYVRLNYHRPGVCMANYMSRYDEMREG